MSRQLKVYGGLVLRPTMPRYAGRGHGRQARCVVAATSQAKAVEILGHHVTRGYFRSYWCETGNEQEVAVGLGEPGVAFWKELDPVSDEWHRL